MRRPGCDICSPGHGLANVVFPPTSIDVDHKSLFGMQVNTSALKSGSGVVLIRFASRIRKVVRDPESLPLSDLIAVCATVPRNASLVLAAV